VISADEPTLKKRITQLMSLMTAEADVQAHLRDMLRHTKLGIQLSADQIVVDTAVLPGSRKRPDLSIYELADVRGANRPDHLVAIIELKKDNRLDRSIESVWREKRVYIQPATRHFYLVDQQQGLSALLGHRYTVAFCN
jgi:hypothetical protein